MCWTVPDCKLGVSPPCPTHHVSTLLMLPRFVSCLLYTSVLSSIRSFLFFFLLFCLLYSRFLSRKYQWDSVCITVAVKDPARNGWHTQIGNTLERFISRTVYQVWEKCTTQGVVQYARPETRELLPPLDPKGWGKGTWNLEGEYHRERPHWEGTIISVERTRG